MLDKEKLEQELQKHVDALTLEINNKFNTSAEIKRCIQLRIAYNELLMEIMLGFYDKEDK